MGINAHHPSSVHTSPPSESVLACSYPPGRVYASDHDDERKKGCHDPVGDTVKEKEKEASYENRKAVGMNAQHTSSKHEFPKSVLAYSYPPRRLHDAKTRQLGRLEGARLKAEDVKVANPCHDDSKPQLPGSPKPADLESYSTEAPLHTPSSSHHHLSSSHHPDYDTMPSHDEELPSSLVLMHCRLPYGYINHSELFTEDVFEWALWILGLALAIAIGIEILSMWNRRMKSLMEGSSSSSSDEDEGGDMCADQDQEIKRYTKPKQTPTSDQLRSWHEKISMMTSQYTAAYQHSPTGKGLDVDDETDENGMEKSSW